MSTPKREMGTIKSYNRGFGFIGRHTCSEDIFFHIKDFRKVPKRRGGVQPEIGMEVCYDIGIGSNGRLAAKDIMEVPEGKRREPCPRDSVRSYQSRKAANPPELQGRSRGIIKSQRPHFQYGFIVEEKSQRKVFFRWKSVTFKEFPLRVGEKVDFVMEDEPVIGVVATDIRPYLVQGEHIQMDEDRQTEFKSLVSSNSPERQIGCMCNKYLCAFLNSSGGDIFFGVEDNGTVSGLLMSQWQRDTARKDVDFHLSHFKPPVEPERYRLAFIKVYQRRPETQELKEITDCFVVRVSAISAEEKNLASCNWYSNSRDEAWIRREAGVQKMPMSMLQARIEAGNKSNLEKQVADLKAQLAAATQSNNLQASAPGNPMSVSAPDVSRGGRAGRGTVGAIGGSMRMDSSEEKIVTEAMQMEYTREKILDAVSRVKKSGRLVSLNAVLDELG
uniref:CSD domain-containing protein n=1 Tax=Lotharella oceanica TaxID=641309 RepID=A0A7S2XF74_9EUKA|eukprot:CAMPEP_0170167842 /NCGR_PEP_ID=MMETSP0040_2-20121228/1123_1 /TAXON_ID=641309 /ORGANISM="Lotharella oceanica, Strain CCMP622" /LENGTH=444 /DNA_ID=CAMNT_0010405983 /DNA_START=11 /DNA_END=1345 /DNA_ORIENTATION=-